jgi:uridine phosphorylase
MGEGKYPILEFDPERDAVIEPSRAIKPLPDMPERCVMVFFREVLDKASADLEPIGHVKTEYGLHHIYVLADEPVAVVHPGVGAPLAAGVLEEMIAFGARKFIACGGAGVLNREIAAGHVVIPDSAVRDEGTSYHYLPPGGEVRPSPGVVDAIRGVMEAHNIPYIVGKTWTTDAIYRETRGKVAKRRDEGCVTVEMEAAAFFAVAAFRGVTFGQILYGGDDVSGEDWDSRRWDKRTSIREKLFYWSVESVLRL